MVDKNALEAPCGIHCGLCKLNQALTDEKLRQTIEKMNMHTCTGCRSIDGHCPVIGEQCATWVCTQHHGVEFCSECSEFPCVKLAPSSDRADKLPHNIKVFSLSLRKAKGAHEWSKQIGEIYDRYYRGKMVIGQGPKLPEEKT
jgi:hypothetical protein